MTTVTIRISRFKSGIIDPPVFFTYQITPSAGWTVLDALEQIRIDQEPSLMYRRSCHHASCGTCACTINGKEQLACKTLLTDVHADIVTLEPLHCFHRIGDLVTVRSTLFHFLQPDWSYLRTDDRMGNRDLLLGGQNQPVARLEACIECGCCVSACPVVRDNPRFIGPAALAAINNERKKNPSAKVELLAISAAPQGDRLCQRALSCSRVCPAAVYPARHILELRNQHNRSDDHG